MIQLPIEHISFSSMSLFASNQRQFFKNYVLGIWDFKTSPAMLVGKAFHKTMEVYTKTNDIDRATDEGSKMIQQVKDDDIEWGKTGSREKCLKEFNQVISFYQQESPDLGKVIGAEITVTTDHGFEKGETLPLPVKAVTDLVTEKGGEICLWDYKVVSSFSNPDEEDPAKIMQAMFNFLTIQAKLGKTPKKMTYIEVKKSKNRDNAPQLGYYEIDYAKHISYRDYFKAMYTGVIMEIANEDKVYLPNLRDMFSAKESWEDFTKEVIGFGSVPSADEVKKAHASSMKNTIRKVNYTESEVVNNDSLTQEDKIRIKLQEFGIPVQMDDTYEGASVTLYTAIPARGVRMAQFTKFKDDIKLALEAKSVRVMAPIPGTKVVGIEVNNSKQEFTKLGKNDYSMGSMTIPVGTDVYGKTQLLDITAAPHMMIAGTTGSGKSVFMNVIIKALTKQMTPDQLKMILIDPKRTEFNKYKNLPHLHTKIVTETEEASLVLEWLTVEMDSRYKRLEAADAVSIDEYNKDFNDMPYIVTIIDEMADLMLSDQTTRNKITKLLTRLAQKARACGIHLIIATQRPSVDVLPGILKANFPTQLAFMVNKKIDSQVILDQPGAEELIGKGDCLLSTPENRGLVRLQSFYL